MSGLAGRSAVRRPWADGRRLGSVMMPWVVCGGGEKAAGEGVVRSRRWRLQSRGFGCTVTPFDLVDSPNRYERAGFWRSCMHVMHDCTNPTALVRFGV